MHSVLSDTQYQHLSGTRCAMDMVEIPSHLFEYFAGPGRPRVVGQAQGDGDPMPREMIARLRASKELFGATDLQQQCMFAPTDLEVHALDPATLTEGSVSDVAARVQAAHSFMRVESGTSWELRFGTCGRRRTTPTRTRSVSPRTCGASSSGKTPARAREALREGMLRHGGAREPGAILRDMLGDGALITDHVGAAPDPTSMLADLNRGR